jgi:hypothetical protein
LGFVVVSMKGATVGLNLVILHLLDTGGCSDALVAGNDEGNLEVRIKRRHGGREGEGPRQMKNAGEGMRECGEEGWGRRRAGRV